MWLYSILSNGKNKSKTFNISILFQSWPGRRSRRLTNEIECYIIGGRPLTNENDTDKKNIVDGPI